jgi:hypothetical protein
MNFQMWLPAAMICAAAGMPAWAQVSVKPDETVVLSVHAVGAQVYDCKDAAPVGVLPGLAILDQGRDRLAGLPGELTTLAGRGKRSTPAETPSLRRACTGAASGEP